MNTITFYGTCMEERPNLKRWFSPVSVAFSVTGSERRFPIATSSEYLEKDINYLKRTGIRRITSVGW
jgi:hypothetical protein